MCLPVRADWRIALGFGQAYLGLGLGSSIRNRRASVTSRQRSCWCRVIGISIYIGVLINPCTCPQEQPADIGNIAKVMQAAFGPDQPDYGFLNASSFIYEGTTLSLDKPIKPFVELEPAFVLRSSLKGPNITVADVISAIDYAIPAIEIIDSRVKDWAIDLPDTLADNGSTGAIIIEEHLEGSRISHSEVCVAS
ncbi:hypothetical protein BDW68DRAFT_158813 [Aspergillus falconensis]